MSDQPISAGKIWTCKIGEHSPTRLGADGPMRNAVADAYEAMTGHPPAFIFSGWGGTLDEGERAVVENRMPRHATVVSEALAQIGIYEAALMKLATLGNGPLPGNSIGNVIAQDALAKGAAILSTTDTEGRKDE